YPQWALAAKQNIFGRLLCEIPGSVGVYKGKCLSSCPSIPPTNLPQESLVSILKILVKSLLPRMLLSHLLVVFFAMVCKDVIGKCGPVQRRACPVSSTHRASVLGECFSSDRDRT
ncbi:hypothetical protein MJO28_013336, partial [Puccinia striiformis f. sp. tritici]